MRRAVAVAMLLALAAPVAAQGRTSRHTEAYDEHFRHYSKRFFGPGFDWRLFKAQGMAESDLNPNATSRVGARGIMQLMPSTYQLIASRRPEMQRIDDPEWNIAAGIMHDRYLWNRFRREPAAERARFMFGAYNAGEGYIIRAARMAHRQQLDSVRWTAIEQVAPSVPRWRWRETLGYVRTIERNHQALGRTGAPGRRAQLARLARPDSAGRAPAVQQAGERR